LRNGIEWRVTMYSSYAPASNGVSGGLMGDAADFNGSNTSIDVPNSTDFLSPAFTVEGWMYMNESPTAHGEDETAFVQKDTGSPYRAYGLAESDGSNSTSGNWYNSAGSGSYAGTYSGSTSAGAWHYVVLRHDPSQVGSELSVLTDGSTSGTYTASSTGAMWNANDVLRFGADYDGGARLDGAMDEIRYHSVALDNSYLQTRFNNINSQYAFWNVGSESTQPSTATTSYTENYSYDLLGNLLSKTGEGNYTYAGNTGSSYADPDAATMIGSSTLSYDNNGNLLSIGSTTYAWDYANRLLSTGSSTYAYDAFSNRVKKTVGTTTTMYPNTLYSQSGNTITRNVYDTMGNLVSTVNGGTSTSTVYIHPDILGSTNVITNASGQFLEAMNYRPFGSTNLDLGTTGNESRGYIGQTYDASSNLNYLNARYQDPVRGQFLSEDPIFLGNPLEQNIVNPQSLNSYSYAENNPVTKKDPTGLFVLSSGLIQKNDTLGSITSQINSTYGTNYTYQQLAQSSGISNPNLIYAGKYITGYSNPQVYASTPAYSSHQSLTNSGLSANSALGAAGSASSNGSLPGGFSPGDELPGNYGTAIENSPIQLNGFATEHAFNRAVDSNLSWDDMQDLVNSPNTLQSIQDEGDTILNITPSNTIVVDSEGYIKTVITAPYKSVLESIGGLLEDGAGDI
jgi:RHS repeat-associated protein